MKATFGMAAKRCNAWWVYCFIHGTLLGNSSFRDGILGTRAAEVKKTVLHDFCSLKGQEQSKQSETINNQTLRLFVFFLFIFLRIFWVFCSTFKFLMKSSHFFTFDTRSPSKFRCPRLRSGPGGNHRKVKAKITNLICMKILESTWSSVVKIHQNQSFNSFGSFCMYLLPCWDKNCCPLRKLLTICVLNGFLRPWCGFYVQDAYLVPNHVHER